MYKMCRMSGSVVSVSLLSRWYCSPCLCWLLLRQHRARIEYEQEANNTPPLSHLLMTWLSFCLFFLYSPQCPQEKATTNSCSTTIFKNHKMNYMYLAQASGWQCPKIFSCSFSCRVESDFYGIITIFD